MVQLSAQLGEIADPATLPLTSLGSILFHHR